MTITSIEPIVVALPFTHGGPPTGFGGRRWTTLDYLVLRVETSDGIVGFGEGFGYNAIPATRAAVETIVGPLALGADETQVDALISRLERALHLFGRSGPVVYALGALEIALWDIAGKSAGQPVYELLGASRRESVDAYASAMPLGSPSVVATEAARATGAGLRGVKLHESDVACVLAAREAVGPDVALMLDSNCDWSLEEALSLGEALAPAGLTWWEEPVWPPEDATALGALRRAAGIPTASGENATTAAEVRALAVEGRCDYLQPSVTKVGGITAFRRMADAAISSGALLAPHSPYLGPGLLATLQLAAVYPQTRWVEHLWAEPEQPLFGDAGLPDALGRIAIPQGPGLGADPDADVLAKYRVA